MLKLSLADQVYEIIKERIVTHQFNFGERIDIQKLESEFEISQTPILFALRKLQETGLVENRPHVGYFVLELTEQDVEEIYELREMFELHALKHAIRFRDAEELKQLREEIKKIQTIENEEERRAKFQETDKKLHLSFISKSNNRRLNDLILKNYEIITVSMFLGTEWEGLLDEHNTLIDSLIKRDFNEARSILKKHIRQAKKEAIEHVRENMRLRSDLSPAAVLDDEEHRAAKYPFSIP